jgi:hypothetical protein
MIIDFNDDDENAPDSMRSNCDMGSNQIDETDLHAWKHFEPTI